MTEYNDSPAPLVMGIINITDNSFYAPSRALSPSEIYERFETMLKEGADIIDLGACSTRPGSTPCEESEELHNIIMAVKELKKRCLHTNLREVVSIDTFRSSVVSAVYDIIGPFTVNDISAGEDDPLMLKKVAELGLPYIAMHKRGTPLTMQNLTEYKQDIVTEVFNYFKKFATKAQAEGVQNWILDPGFGFAKTVEQNFQLLKNLDKFKELNRRILVGLSRKSMIYKPLDITPEESLPYTTALNFYALTKGASILRVHDVKEAKNCVNLYRQFMC